MIKLSITKNDLDCAYNPFGGLKSEEIGLVLIPKLNFQTIIKEIDTNDNTIIEFLGKQGRGKTTHLSQLHQIYEESEMFALNGSENEFQNIIDCNAKLILVDSIHQLSISERFRLFRSDKNLVFTTHTTRWLEFKLARVTGITYRFEGLDKLELRNILTNRIRLASRKNDISENVKLDEKLLDSLIQKYKDDYRAILRHLYENFNQ